MKINRIALMLGLLLGMAASAEPPGGGPGGARSGQRGPGPGAGPHRSGEEPVAWEEVEAFMKETSPNRYQAMQSLPADQQEKVRERARGMYRMARWSKSDPALWESKKQEIMIEDELFALRMRLLHKDPPPSAAAQKAVRNEMRDKVRQLVDLRLQERASRIDKLRQFIADEEARLNKDRSSVNDLVDARLKEEIEEGGQFGRPDRPRWPRDQNPRGRDER